MFNDRTEAGRLLAEKLTAYRNKPDTIILALVRGGVAIGRALANELRLPLFPYVVRKLGHPSHREYGIGAIAEGGATYLDETAMKWSGVTWKDLEPIADEETREMKRRVQAYHVRPRPDLKEKTVILTDDGAATGGTMFAAVDDIRGQMAKKIVVALPVSPPDTAEKLQKKADECVVLRTPANFGAVGQWYRHFPQCEDGDVLVLLREKGRV